MEQIIEVHDALRAELVARFGADTGNDISLLYGGSVKAANAAEIFARAQNVDGALVGGASLKGCDDFGPPSLRPWQPPKRAWRVPPAGVLSAKNQARGKNIAPFFWLKIPWGEFARRQRGARVSSG